MVMFMEIVFWLCVGAMVSRTPWIPSSIAHVPLR